MSAKILGNKWFHIWSAAVLTGMRSGEHHAAINSLKNTETEEMNFTAPMTISKKDFHIIREKIVKLIQESIEVAKASEAEDLAIMTIDFF